MNDYDKNLTQNIADSCSAFLKEFKKQAGINVKQWKVDRLLPSKTAERQERQICLTITF